MKVGTLENIPITEKAFAYLGKLLETGIFGCSNGEVAQRLIDAGIREAIKEGLIHEAFIPSPAGLNCPNCSSPKIEKNEVMGPYDYSCMDCMQGFNL